MRLTSDIHKIYTVYTIVNHNQSKQSNIVNINDER